MCHRGSTRLSAALPRIAVLLVTRCIMGYSILGKTVCAKSTVHVRKYYSMLGNHLVLLKRRNMNDILIQNKSVAS